MLNEIAERAIADHENKSESKEKVKKGKKSKKEQKIIRQYVACGAREGVGIFESVMFDHDEPKFLVLNPYGVFQTLDYVDALSVDRPTHLVPLTRVKTGYRPYRINTTILERIQHWSPDPLELYSSVHKEFVDFLDIEDSDRVVLESEIFESYQQHKLSTTSYPYIVGDKDSGKTRALEMLLYLGYRPLFSPSLPAADVYRFLGYHDEAQGMILEDEAERIHKDSEKMKIYRTGYRRGATVPRIEESGYGKEREQRYYRTFCCKAFDGRWLLEKDDAFMDRCYPISMIQGDPKKDEIVTNESAEPGTPTNEIDTERFDFIKAMLLIWRMKTWYDPLPPISLQLKGRFKELWKPKLRVMEFLGSHEPTTTLQELVNKLWLNKTREMSTNLGSMAIRAVVILISRLGKYEIPFSETWNVLYWILSKYCKKVEYLDTKNGVIHTEEFGDFSKWKLGSVLRNNFSGEPHYSKALGRTYLFQHDEIAKILKKHRINPEEAKVLRKEYSEANDLAVS